VDIDGDGDLDVQVIYYKAPDKIYLNNGKGVFSYSQIKISENTALADLNGDGLIDMFVREDNKGYKVLLNKGKGKFSDFWSIEDETVTQTSVTFCDLDNDKDIDLVITNGDRSKTYPTKVFLNDGKGKFTDSGQELYPAMFGRVAAGDINDDGFADLIISSFRQPNEIWMNNREGKFSKSSINFPNSSSRHTTYLIDINKDKKPDLIIADFFSGSNQIWFNGK
ncbi:MAG: VCBS repeat-containing protein, partial [Calditrichia bacterium]|nr:VCBS repeat-containing protein [Calditrichia bacterium]